MSDDSWNDRGIMWSDMYWDAVSSWRNSYAPRVRLADVLANDLRRVTFACKQFPDGVQHIMVQVVPRRASDAETYFWRVTQVGNVYYAE